MLKDLCLYILDLHLQDLRAIFIFLLPLAIETLKEGIVDVLTIEIDGIRSETEYD